uniref:Uncharacterized protein n=1 Tax=Haptolina brevifila TaxID=156173 RepID=A0A6U7LP99_9EUKA|mmetsp:Transcript_75490/g.149758  ORF Transcript_75490/g.149758 Transcript_75490/m.149758 type:complete len:184 (+) Transcript_75490:406-957(+)
MRSRLDRVAIPLISSNAGGLVVSPDVKIKCAYGDDGTSAEAPGGCWPSNCNAKNPFDYEGKQPWMQSPCGFGKPHQIRNSWRPTDIGKMLELYTQHAQPYKPPQFYSGYNELVYDFRAWNDRLPHTVEAFFVMKRAEFESTNEVKAHKAFLERYRLSTHDVPLLSFDATNFERPFTAAPGGVG